MVTIETKTFTDAVESSEYSKSKAAALAGSCDATLNKLMRGETDLRLSSIEQLADFFHLDVVVSFKPKAPLATNSRRGAKA